MKVQWQVKLNQSLVKEEYILFHSDFRTYDLQTKGSSAIYLVPDDQRGTLKEYAGKKVQIICLIAIGGLDIRVENSLRKQSFKDYLRMPHYLTTG